MRALIQRVTEARVDIAGETIGETGQGLMILVCAMQDDDETRAEALAKKTANLRIFSDDAGKMNKSLLDIGGGALVVSQFTLAADTSRGNRPGFSAAAPPDRGDALYQHFCSALRSHGVEVATGEFGADMRVTLTNDGPITIWLDM